ncbi:TrkH family potassium uptake protein [Oceanidesulfovibrio indonesiensis]|uniref:TrkH family potassium uptake protein n=1 Tax=Oceanidesulfovibrio indonesiensis TaxID=54767 RepID=A0A7M3MBA4_9BACT|nr:potassium transporter TrkG [Oceanidesulfovibrio indonesiensis]TVM15036.1 TrkH family potassium uptake protein [Oceanidesulfovibrio indonesiensis]
MSKDTALSFAIRPQLLLKSFGDMGPVLIALTIVPAAVSVGFAHYAIAMRYGVVILFLLGLTLLARRTRASLKSMQTNEVFALVALLFILVPLLMTYPMMHTGISFLDACFEALSGATTTGLSTLPSVNDMPGPFLFARAWMQWYGGLGIVAFSLALVVQPGGIAKRLSTAEDPGDDLWGGTKAYARRVLGVYLALSAVGVLALLLSGASLFDSVVFAMAAVSTGGYAPYDSSLAATGLPTQLVTVAVCVLGAAPFILFAPAYRKSRGSRIMRVEAMTLAAMCVLGVAIVSLCLRYLDSMDWGAVLKHAPVLAFSAQSTAGFANMDLAPLHAATKAVLLPAMLVGGCVGSTGGGVKILRLLIFVGLLRTFLARVNMPPHAVRPPRLLGVELDENVIRNALLLTVLYVLTVSGSWIAFLAYGYPPLESLFDVVSAVGTVGLSAGVVSNDLPAFLKLVLCLDMLLGRVEIIAILVLLNPSSWIGRRAHP